MDDENRSPKRSEPDRAEAPYEPPKAEEVASEGQAATAAWITTPDASN